ncbi:hypothetical protein WJX84_001220 [Apatococcus fuscideae]|uniref:Uncharacterized protein n=1 Tax=Apatococcus fuscideae TaxID=2026836 RepID=A0AAW1SMW0_9CHLO
MHILLRTSSLYPVTPPRLAGGRGGGTSPHHHQALAGRGHRCAGEQCRACRNNASLFEGSTASWVEMVSTNVLGVCMCTREAVQDMKRRGKWGQVINISSMSGHRLVTAGGSGFYSATKQALRHSQRHCGKRPERSRCLCEFRLSVQGSLTQNSSPLQDLEHLEKAWLTKWKHWHPRMLHTLSYGLWRPHHAWRSTTFLYGPTAQSN